MASLYFKYAAMNSGKTTQLLQARYNYLERGMQALAITARLDDRYGVGKITARIGLDLEVDTFTAETDLFDYVAAAGKAQPVAVLLIDEAHFLSPEQVLQLCRVVDELDIPVLAYGLRTDFQGRFFPGSDALMRYADNLEEIKTICHCGRKATMNARITPQGEIVRDGAQIAIGGNDMYIALCRRHFHDGQSQPQNLQENKKVAA